MALFVVDDGSPRHPSLDISTAGHRESVWFTPLQSPSASNTKLSDTDLKPHGIDLSPLDGDGALEDLDNIAAIGLGLDAEGDEPPIHMTRFPEFRLDDSNHEKESLQTVKPFHRWMKTLRRRAQRPRNRIDEDAKELFPTFPEDAVSGQGHRKSLSDSSFGYVTQVRSASVSLASASILTRSRRNTGRSSHRSKADHSSRASVSGSRLSEEGARRERSIAPDAAVTERLLQRRRILEELISTEESYIGDIKFLMNVYVTILASLPTQHVGLRSSINRNLTEIVELHEEILGELHRTVPNSEYTQADHFPRLQMPTTRRGHQRWHSLDSVPEDKKGTAWLRNVPSMTAEPEIAAEVALIFSRKMHRFFVYEEYGAKYELLMKDVASTHRSMPLWETYQKGLEALAASLGSMNHQLDDSRKSLTIGDLLVKPIQRICKYPLLFSELLKHTPVFDCPNSHIEIESVLVRLREATSEINRATDDPSVRETMEKTWLLQDRLVFPDQCLDTTLKMNIRSLGQIRLCGALHVCWQTREGVNGQYMVCLLYRDCLCLATATAADQAYTIQACIGLSTMKVEEADNARGLQCHTAPFSWKLIFEVDHQLYEIILTACSPKEELEWRSRLTEFIPSEATDRLQPPICSSLSLNIRSLGTVFGKPGTVARRLSIHRATTVGPKSALCQVILKNTTTVKDISSSHLSSPINRSQSLLTTNSRIPILAPARAERTRLEALLSDVWSRRILPFPGITTRSRSEHLVRSSASTVMRKLSVASISKPFARRSASTLTMNNPDPETLPRVDKFNSLITLDCDFSTPALSFEKDSDESQSRLPVIRDEGERTGSCSPSIQDADITSSPGTIRRLDHSKLVSDCQSEKMPASLSALRTSSANSIRQDQARSPSIKSVSSGKENICQVEQSKRPLVETSVAAKPASKWAKVSAINRGMMARGIRSFFR